MATNSDEFNGFDGVFRSQEQTVTPDAVITPDMKKPDENDNNNNGGSGSGGGGGSGDGGGGGSSGRDAQIASNLDYLKNYYSQQWGRPIQDNEVRDAQRAWELGIPIDQWVQSQVAPRGSNTPGSGGGGGGGSSNGGGGGSSGMDYAAQLDAIRHAGDSAQRAIMTDKFERDLQANLAAAGHEVTWDGNNMIIDGRSYTVNTPTGESGYTPGEIPDSSANFTYDDLLKAGEDPQTDQFISSLLAHPESMDALTVDRMKAKSKDELSDMTAQQDQERQALASTYGIQESPWLAAQQLAAHQSRDQALVSGNRAIDATAAATNLSDRRAAADLALQHQTNKSARVIAAANAAIAASAEQGNRLALRESVKQEAAKLNISAQTLMSQHILGLMDDATKRHGIDVDAAMKRYGIDMDFESQMQALAHADQRHLEDLAMELARMNQDDSHFTATQDTDAARAAEEERHNRELEDLQRQRDQAAAGGA